MATKLSILGGQREKSLQALATACKHHRGVASARRSAQAATHLLLKAEVAELQKRKTAEEKSTRTRARHPEIPDMFQGAH